ncbi:uncharacterized protein LOC132279585 [Cornus florida]|uniref:uncharacterized protein LOC132279585 n=1 Tax=Cornus florida TaxID=4283 RepID=UPI00289901BC|nr:uncharacterized protein LOC132279585 [Cornus florida]
MAIPEIQNLKDETWEERTLDLLYDSKIEQDSEKSKSRKSANKKHKLRWMKSPMVIPEVILELQDEALRESALRCLSTFLLEKREEDPINYDRTGYLLYNSCSTMAILLQEILAFARMVADESPTARASKRFLNVLTLFQCIAANKETRHTFVKSFLPNVLIQLILVEIPLETFGNVRAVALSVIGILCQVKEPKIIQWALESNMVEVCQISIEIGNELSKVVGMHILEAILQTDSGMSYICSPTHNHLLKGLMNAWDNLVTRFAAGQEFSPRLLFHIIRCYVLLCRYERGFSIVMESLPDHIKDGSLDDIAEEFPVIRSLVQLLLLIVGKTDECCPVSLPHDLLL